MHSQVEIIMCANPLTIQFQSKLVLSKHIGCIFFTAHNIEFCDKELVKIGPLAERIVIEVIQFSEVRQVFVASNTLTVVLRSGKQWETIPDQILRIFEKALDECGGEDETIS